MRCAGRPNGGGANYMSMKDTGKSRAVLRALNHRFTLVDSLPFHEQPKRTREKIWIDALRPAYVVVLLRLGGHNTQSSADQERTNDK